MGADAIERATHVLHERFARDYGDREPARIQARALADSGLLAESTPAVEPSVYPDDLARGVGGLVADMRDVLTGAAVMLDVLASKDKRRREVELTQALVIDSNDELRELLEELVRVAAKHGAKT